MLAVHVRLLVGNLDNVEDTGRFAENAVHFLQGSTGRLRVEEEHHWEDKGVTVQRLELMMTAEGELTGIRRNLHNRKDNVGLVTDVVKSHRRDHDHQEVEDPVR